MEDEHLISVIIPAYNEERYLRTTLMRIWNALATAGRPSEVIVADNESSDGTRAVAETFGVKICTESRHNISSVRNTGARNAAGDLFIFVDADTEVPRKLFQKIAVTMDDTACLGGAVAVDYGEFRRWWMRFYVLGWKLWEWIAGTRQGATQFCRRDVFEELGGYDESIYLGEDVEFQWRLARLAKARGGRVAFITDPKVSTSPRRFDRMSAGKILLLTNPLFIFLTWRNEKVWKDWYEDPIR